MTRSARPSFAPRRQSMPSRASRPSRSARIPSGVNRARVVAPRGGGRVRNTGFPGPSRRATPGGFPQRGNAGGFPQRGNAGFPQRGNAGFPGGRGPGGGLGPRPMRTQVARPIIAPRGANLGRIMRQRPPVALRPRGPAAMSYFYGGRHWGYWRGPRSIWVGGILRRLVLFSAIPAVYYGTQAYYPQGYVAMARPYCGGQTPDGCNLVWRDVPTEDGGAVAQCVQFCPQGIQPQAVAISSAQVAPQPVGNDGACELKGFSEQNLQGESFTTSDNYPQMQEWNDQIGSIAVTAGTWEFFADDNFGGESIRLSPGEYRQLGDAWTFQISSFMCTEPGPGPAPSPAGYQPPPQGGPPPGGPPPGYQQPQQGYPPQGGPPPGYQQPRR
ncbi:beta/gamma crystallin-related protein [Variibacter gotjawalensis]|nr:beta/gamma crystallin-related protein [Variibacter gotjawalensis]